MRLAVVILALMVASLPAWATDRSWTGTQSGSWGTGVATNNWNPKGVPTTNDNLTFGVLTTNRYNVTCGPFSKSKDLIFTAQPTNYTFGGSTPWCYGDVVMYDHGSGRTNKFNSGLSLYKTNATITVERLSGVGVTLHNTAILKSSSPNTKLTLTGGGLVVCDTIDERGDLVIETPTICDTLYSSSNTTVKSGWSLTMTTMAGWGNTGTYTLESGATNTFKPNPADSTVAGITAVSSMSLRGTLELILDESISKFEDGNVSTLHYIQTPEVPFTDWALEAVKVHPSSVGSFANCTFSKTTRRFPARSQYIDSGTTYIVQYTTIGDVWVSTPNSKGYRLWLRYGIDGNSGIYEVDLICLRDDSGDMFSIMGE